MKLNISQEDFGTLCICAIRYCHDRQTYMPSLVQQIVGEHLYEISDKDLTVLLNDCDFQEQFNLYGDEMIDKPGWLQWKQTLQNEMKDRKGETHE